MFLGTSSLQAQCGCTGLGPNAKVGDEINLSILSQANNLNPDQIFTGCLEVFGQFTVDIDWNLSGAEIVMMPGAEIVVQRIATNGDWLTTLDIDDTEIHGCDELWKSITLRNYNTGEANSELVLQNSEVRDGEHAINLPDNGSRLTVLNNTFNSNYVSIYSLPSSGNPNIISINQSQPITGNTFENTYNLFPHYNSNIDLGLISYSGVEIHNNFSFQVGLVNGNSQNIFTGLRFGAIFQNSDFSLVGGVTISNLEGEGVGVHSINSMATGVRNSTMTNLNVGFHGDNSGSVIVNNQMVTDAVGVNLLNCNQRRNVILHNQMEQEQHQKTDFILAINQGLEPEYAYQDNEKITNQIFLETIAQGEYKFTDHQKQIINSIANQCVTEGGKGVLHARALQQFYMTKFYEVDSGCGDNSNYRIGNTKNQKITIYPNPNFGDFSIQFEYPIEENLDLEFYDMNGRLLFKDKLFRGEFNYTFKDLSLESGMYICKLKSEVGNVLTRKIVINKF